MCSSYTFPKIFGGQKAFEILCLGKVYNGADMHRLGLVTQLFSTEKEMTEAASNFITIIHRLNF